MKRSILLIALYVLAFPAHADLDSECAAKFSAQLEMLETGFAKNRAEFDAAVDNVLSRYAARHPAASKEDYRALFDDMFRERLSKRFEMHENLLRGYKAVLNGDAEPPENACKVSLRRMNGATKQTIAKNKALYDDLAKELEPVPISV